LKYVHIRQEKKKEKKKKKKKAKKNSDIGVHLGTTHGASKRETQKDSKTIDISLPEISGKNKRLQKTPPPLPSVIDWPQHLFFSLSTLESI
jgi:hypothetical protein